MTGFNIEVEQTKIFMIMDYEQKYKKALSWMQSLYNGLHGKTKEEAERYFPELAESEDEQIRKEILGFIKNWKNPNNLNRPQDYPMFTKNEEQCDKYIAWLEKQGEKESDPRYKFLKELLTADDIYQMAMNDAMVQEAKTKAIDALSKLEIDNLLEIEKQSKQKPEPKFKVGDTIRCKYDERKFTIKAVDLEGGFYTYTQEGCGNDIDYADDVFELVEQKPADNVEPKFKVGDFIVSSYYMGKVTMLTNDAYLLDSGQGIPFSCERDAHLWTIQDAKDGNVLYSPCCKLLWIYKDENTCYVGYNLNYNSDSIVIDKLICIPNDVQPATKEQRDILFSKMREFGYEWDAEKKELKKIEQNPTWSEEDERIYCGLFADIRIKQYCSTNTLGAYYNKQINWLKSLKQRLGGDR